MNDFKYRESTKLKLLEALNKSDKPLALTDWASLSGVGKATLYRYLPLLIEDERLVIRKFGPKNSTLYLLNPKRAIPSVDKASGAPVGKSKASAKPIEVVSKRELAEVMYGYVGKFAADRLPVSGTLMNYSLVLNVALSNLYGEVQKAAQGDPIDKDMIDDSRHKLHIIKSALERELTFINSMLLTNDIWNPRQLHGFLNKDEDGDFKYDSVTISQRLERMRWNREAALTVLNALAEATSRDITVTESSIVIRRRL